VRLIVYIQYGNAAANSLGDMASILETDVAMRLKHEGATKGVIHDLNGNVIGEFKHVGDTRELVQLATIGHLEED
jgi:hypothetical protein